jgi:hypothetical protein
MRNGRSGDPVATGQMPKVSAIRLNCSYHNETAWRCIDMRLAFPEMAAGSAGLKCFSHLFFDFVHGQPSYYLELLVARDQ